MNIDQLRKAIDTVVEYNWESEREDYFQNCSDDPDGNQRANHIFETLVMLNNFVEGTTFSPADFELGG